LYHSVLTEGAGVLVAPNLWILVEILRNKSNLRLRRRECMGDVREHFQRALRRQFVNGNGNNKKKRRPNCLSMRYWLGIVLLMRSSVRATAVAHKIDPSKLAKVEKGVWLRVCGNGEGDAHHQGGSEVRRPAAL